jgi:acyl carrier protein
MRQNQQLSRTPWPEAGWMGESSGHDHGTAASTRRQELLQQVAAILQRIAGIEPEGVTPEARLIDDIGVDSLGFYEILIEADEQLGLKIEERDLLGFRTVGDILDYLESHTDAT